MVNVLTIIALLVAVLLILIVLIQKPKGGGVTGNLTGGANQIFGVKKTSDLVEKTTWILSGIIAVVLLITTAFNKPMVVSDELDEIQQSEEIQKALENPTKLDKPSVPLPAPGGNPGGVKIEQPNAGTQEVQLGGEKPQGDK